MVFTTLAVANQYWLCQSNSIYYVLSLHRFYSMGTAEEELYTKWGWAGYESVDGSTLQQGTLVG